MTREEAEVYANNMTYRDAINNLMKARSIPYRKATFIKINELLKALGEPIGHWTKDFMCSNCGCKCYPLDIDFGDYNYCPNCGLKMEEGD